MTKGVERVGRAELSGLAGPVELIDQTDSAGAEADLQRGLDLLAEVKSGTRGRTLRLYRPQPTMAFGQRDANLPGFSAAAAAARQHGFEPLVRKAGGRAAPYHQGCLVIDHLEPETDAVLQSKFRFNHFAELFAGVLIAVGVDAGIGEIPGEYCPGEYSVHGSGNGGQQLKLVGTAQRVVAGAWLFSSVIVVENGDPLRAVLVDCYRELGLDWNPATAGAAADLRPGLRVEDVKAALLDAYRK